MAESAVGQAAQLGNEIEGSQVKGLGTCGKLLVPLVLLDKKCDSQALELSGVDCCQIAKSVAENVQQRSLWSNTL